MGQTLAAEFDFRSDEFFSLSIKDRIRKCRVMAMEAKDLAALADRDFRDAYLDLARQWSALDAGTSRLQFQLGSSPVHHSHPIPLEARPCCRVRENKPLKELRGVDV